MAAARALVLDIDGVLVRPLETWAQRLAGEHGLDPERTADVYRGPFEKCLLGGADMISLLPPFLEQWGYPHLVERFVADWFATEHAVDGELIAAVRALRANGFTTALATNQERYRLAYLREEMGLGHEFDAVVASCEAGCAKPSQEFFAFVERQLGVGPAEIVFWDDLAQNVEVAAGRGWQATLFTATETLLDSLPRHFG